MAVFTSVTREALARWLEGYALGELCGFEGIASGIENSNFFVTTTSGRFVLTLFERLAFEELPFYLSLMHHLAQRGVPCPDPVADRRGEVLGRLEGKPAALFTRLPGQAVEAPAASHCAQVGALLARMHRAAADYSGVAPHPRGLPNPRGLPWCRHAAASVAAFLDAEQAALLHDELAEQEAFAASPRHAALPAGPVHADLFRGNVLFEAGPDGSPRIGGVIDFYFAGVDTWLFDLAVAVNDWCIDQASGAFDAPRLAALLEAYRTARPPNEAEVAAWPMMLRAGALRFWLSRLFDLHLPRPAELVTPKDPAHFERILRARRRGVPALA